MGRKKKVVSPEEVKDEKIKEKKSNTKQNGKITFYELITKIKKNNLVIDDLKIKRYLPLLDKSIVVKQICDSAVYYDQNGLAYIDMVQKKISICMTVLLNYCNISIGNLEVDKTIDVIDVLLESKFYNKIEEAIGDDLSEFHYMIDVELSNIIDRNNSIQAILAKGINTLIQKMPDEKGLTKIIKLISKEFKNFEPEKLTMMQDMLKITQSENK